jgi:hypothetical protein
MDFTLLVKTMPSGQIEASVLEIPSCRVQADSRDSAIESLRFNLAAEIQDAEVVTCQMPIRGAKPPWLKFAGIFENNPDFAEIVDEIQVRRDAWGDEEMDESEYRR